MFLDNCDFVSDVISEIRVGTNASRYKTEFFESFHESQDPALDRLLHMSPREESQLLMEEDTGEAVGVRRLSDLIEFAPNIASTAAPSKTNRGAASNANFDRKTSDKQSGSSRRSVFPRPNVEEIKKVKELALQRQIFHNSLPQAATAFKDSVEPNLPPSRLAALMQRPNGRTPTNSLAIQDELDDSSSTTLVIYLPNGGSPMQVKVPDSVTAAALISRVLSSHQAKGLTPALIYSTATDDTSNCYELRLHAGGGEADEDVPALDRARPVNAFGESEFCLCETDIAAVKKATNGRLPAAASKGVSHSQLASSKSQNAISNVRFVSVVIANAAGANKLRIDESTRARDLLVLMAKKHRLRMFTTEYEFHVKAADQDRLQLMSTAIPMDAKLFNLGLLELELRTRVYADSPKLREQALQSGTSLSARSKKPEGPTQQSSDSRPSPDAFMLTDVTAAVFKEWNVVKKNKFGRKQKRVMGVDSRGIYNRRRDAGADDLAGRDGSTTPSKEVFRASRETYSVLRVDYLDTDPCDFRILFVEKNGEVVSVDYTAETPRDCAEIVAKINYIIRYLLTPQQQQLHTQLLQQAQVQQQSQQVFMLGGAAANSASGIQVIVGQQAGQA